MKHVRRKNLFDHFDEQLDIGSVAKITGMAILSVLAATVIFADILTN